MRRYAVVILHKTILFFQVEIFFFSLHFLLNGSFVLFLLRFRSLHFPTFGDCCVSVGYLSVWVSTCKKVVSHSMWKIRKEIHKHKKFSDSLYHIVYSKFVYFWHNDILNKRHAIILLLYLMLRFFVSMYFFSYTCSVTSALLLYVLFCYAVWLLHCSTTIAVKWLETIRESWPLSGINRIIKIASYNPTSH